VGLERCQEFNDHVARSRPCNSGRELVGPYQIDVAQFRIREMRPASDLMADSRIVTVYLSYSLRFILLDANIDVSRHILVVDISILASSNMDRRE
jgi:hypothetical protein